MSAASPPRRTLVLLRHAKAEQTLGKPDHDRQLTARGHRDAADMGHWLAQRVGPFDVVLCSSATRTRQTWDSAGAAGASAAALLVRKQIYHAGAAGVLSSLHEDVERAASVLVVGHSPTMPALAEGLTGGAGDRLAHAALAQGFPTCAAAVLSFDGEWSQVGAGTCELVAFHVGRG